MTKLRKSRPNRHRWAFYDIASSEKGFAKEVGFSNCFPRHTLDPPPKSN